LKPFFDGYIPGQDWVIEHRPDVAFVIFNDHGSSFFLDKVPTFAVGCAEEYRPVDEGWGSRAIPPFKGAVDLSWLYNVEFATIPNGKEPVRAAKAN
jgi:protocatechuate 4,5-dioxygenase beta chain